MPEKKHVLIEVVLAILTFILIFILKHTVVPHWYESKSDDYRPFFTTYLEETYEEEFIIKKINYLSFTKEYRCYVTLAENPRFRSYINAPVKTGEKTHISDDSIIRHYLNFRLKEDEAVLQENKVLQMEESMRQSGIGILEGEFKTHIKKRQWQDTYSGPVALKELYQREKPENNITVYKQVYYIDKDTLEKDFSESIREIASKLWNDDCVVLQVYYGSYSDNIFTGRGVNFFQLPKTPVKKLLDGENVDLTEYAFMGKDTDYLYIHNFATGEVNIHSLHSEESSQEEGF